MNLGFKDLSQNEFLELAGQIKALKNVPKSIFTLIHNLYISIRFLDDIFDSKRKALNLNLKSETNKVGTITKQTLSNSSNGGFKICEGTVHQF